MRPSQFHLGARQDSGVNPPGNYGEVYGGHRNDVQLNQKK